MKGSIFCLVAFLALGNGFYIRYNSAFPIPYGAYNPTSYAIYNPTAYAAFNPTQYAAFQPAPLIKAFNQAEIKTEKVELTPYSGITPVVTTAPVAPFLSKYHTQSSDGSYAFGYFGGPSSRQEFRDQFGNVRGAFNYIDPYGVVQSQQYIAGKSGFRVAATNLPVAPLVPEIFKFAEPKLAEETEVVEEATAELENPVEVVEESKIELESPVEKVEETKFELESPVKKVEETKFELESPVKEVEVAKSELENTAEVKSEVRSKREADPAFFTATYNVPNPTFVAPAIHTPLFKSVSNKETSEITPFDFTRFNYPSLFPAHFPYSFYSHHPTVYSAPHFSFKIATKPATITTINHTY